VGIEGYGLTVSERVHLQMPSTKHTAKYLNTKREKMGHLLTAPKEMR
ncbi:MAG: bifunctional 3,4-dihydroxy-2-butanone-4-phosphate synthase/GTP cyclohydrolase II, partial [Elusimicrobiota bacterium]